MVRDREQIPHRAHPAALPSGALKATLDSFNQPGMCIGDHEADPGEATLDQVGEELAPERLVLRVADVGTKELTVPIST
jgi:hypothetical protein